MIVTLYVAGALSIVWWTWAMIEIAKDAFADYYIPKHMIALPPAPQDRKHRGIRERTLYDPYGNRERVMMFRRSDGSLYARIP